MRRKQNVIVFSAGESLRNKKVEYIQKQLTQRENDICCLDWQDLFRGANHADRIALLPALMKKIPTFDFALIFAEGVDQVTMRGKEKYTAMRDNVVFELGLCLMALGAERVILLSEEGMRLPDDLLGIGRIGLEHITYTTEPDSSQVAALLEQTIHRKSERLELPLSVQVDRVISHISDNADIVSPVFVGAAVSSAEAYFSNFIIRLLAGLDGPLLREGHNTPLVLTEEPTFQIVFPTTVDSMTPDAILHYYERLGAENFVIENAGARSLSFRGTLRDGRLTIVDVPTSVTASYSVVNSILNIDSDDIYDRTAEERFVTKEMDIYEYTLKKLFTPEVASARLSRIRDNDKRARIIRALERIQLVRRDLLE